MSQACKCQIKCAQCSLSEYGDGKTGIDHIVYCPKHASVDTLTQQVATLRGALEKYGEHLNDCHIGWGVPPNYTASKCTCGFSEVYTATAPPEARKEGTE